MGEPEQSRETYTNTKPLMPFRLMSNAFCGLQRRAMARDKERLANGHENSSNTDESIELWTPPDWI